MESIPRLVPLGYLQTQRLLGAFNDAAVQEENPALLLATNTGIPT